jgi:hypothetical protein
MATEQTALAVQDKKQVRAYTAENAREVGLPSAEALNYMTSVAKYLAPSALCTPDMGTSMESIQANALAKMLTGREFGIEPMAALRTIYIVKGRIGLSYDTMISILLDRGIKIEWLKDDATGVEVRLTRPDGLMTYVSKFGPEEAAAAGLSVMDQYKKRPVVMYRARALSNGFRVIGGCGARVYERGELNDIREDEPDTTPAEDTDYKIGLKPAATTAAPAPPTPASTVVSAAPVGPVVAPAPKPTPAPAPQPEAPPAPAAPTAPPPPVVVPEPEQNDPEPEVQQAEPTLQDRVLVVRDKIGGSPKTAMGVINGFFRGFLGVTTLPKQIDAYRDAIGALENASKVEMDQLIQKPAELGKNAAKGVDPVAEAVAPWGWTNPTMVSAIRAVLEFKQQSIPEFLEWMGFLKVPQLLVPDAFSFLCVASATFEAHQVLQIAAQSGISVHNVVLAIVEKLGGPLNEATPDAIASAMNAVRTKLCTKAAAAEPAETEQESLFG